MGQRTGAVYLTGEGVDFSLSFVQSSGQLAVLLMAQVQLALHPLQLQTQRLTLRLLKQIHSDPAMPKEKKLSLAYL